jgi:hypothetical protein
LYAVQDALATPAVSPGRGGDLDPAVWAVGRIQPSNIGNPNQPNYTRKALIPDDIKTGLDDTLVFPPDDMVIADAGYLNLAAVIQNYGYIGFMSRRPFDFAGRKGRIAFDCDFATVGALHAYIQVSITEDPVPCPTFLQAVNDETGPIPRNALMLPFRNNQSLGTARINIGGGCVYEDFVKTNLDPDVELTSTSCPATSPGALNHVEIYVSASRLEVWMTDTLSGGSFPNNRLIYASDLDLPFTRGYVHIAARNHASVKYGSALTTTYNFRIRNFLMDGPRLPVPRAYEIPDNTTTSNIGGDQEVSPPESATIEVMHLGRNISATALVTPLTFAGSVDLTRATSAQMTLIVFMQTLGFTGDTTWTLQYQFNGGTWRSRTLTADEAAGINTDGTAGQMGLLIDVNLGDLQPGTNTVNFRTVNVPTGYPAMVANIDLMVHA